MLRRRDKERYFWVFTSLRRWTCIRRGTQGRCSALLFALLPQRLPLHLSMPSLQPATRLLQHTLICWPPSWAVTLPRQGPAHCRTPLWAHPQIWPCFPVYAGCAPLAPLPTEDFVPYNFLSLAVPPGSCSAYLRDLCRTTMGIPGRRSLRSTEQGLLLVPSAHTATMQNRAFSVVGPSLWSGVSLALRLFPRIVSNSFYAHLKTFLFGRRLLESGASP